jgi:hypothetical protein
LGSRDSIFPTPDPQQGGEMVERRSGNDPDSR